MDADAYLIVFVTVLLTSVVILLIQIGISKLKDIKTNQDVLSYVFFMLNLAILGGLTVVAAYYSMLAGADAFHSSVAFGVIIAGAIGILMVILERKYRGKKE